MAVIDCIVKQGRFLLEEAWHLVVDGLEIA